MQLALDRIHADAAGERRVDFHRLAGNALPAVFVGDEMERPHIVQPVRELDEEHADVAAESKDELAEVLCLLGAVRLQFEAGELVTPSTSPATSEPN